MRIILTFLIMLSELIATPAQAQIYRYIDERGHSVYIDNLAAVPAQHRQDFIDEQGERGESADSTTDLTTQDSTDWDLRWQELIADSQPESTPQRASTTQVRIINNQVIVPVQIILKRKQVQLNLILDTGASITLLHARSIKKLNIGKMKSRRARLADGSSAEIKVAKMTEVSVGPINLQNTPVAIVENQGKRLNVDGLLGLDVLRHHPFNIDYQNQQIVWQ